MKEVNCILSRGYYCSKLNRSCTTVEPKFCPLQSLDKTSKIYISGPMSGYNDCNRKAFFDAESFLRKSYGLEQIFNPANNDQTLTWEQQMEIDMKEVEKATHVILLEGWNRSSGSRMEVCRAIELGLKIVMLNDLTIEH